jgi:DNA-binding winged helix-turn-helix (wHTH) protein
MNSSPAIIRASVPSRFRFDEFVLSPRQRLLLRAGMPVQLIPKYFDLLVLLVDRRQEAVSKQTIFADVWSDVVVSDGALSQAVRTLRRTLGDNPREPRFIRTVSRHGYQFVCLDVREEPDDGALTASPQTAPLEPAGESVERLVDRLFAGVAAGDEGRDDVRETAERLHALSTTEAIDVVKRRPNHAAALAVMRDARWNVPDAGVVPLDAPSSIALIQMRLGDARRTAARRWAGAAGAGAAGGAMAGFLGGLALWLAPGSQSSPQSSLALAALGALAGGVGGGGIGAGLATAEALARSRRGLALMVSGGLAGAVVATIAHVIVRALVDGLVGAPDVALPGVFEGLVIGAAVGGGYALATPQPPGGGMSAPTGQRRAAAVVTVGLVAAAAGTALAMADRTLVGGLVNEIAKTSPSANLVLAPLGQLIGEPDFGPITAVALSAFEAGVFGAAVAFGLTIRPKSAISQ